MNDTRPAFVYVLQCADESFYVGVTFDVHARLSTHNTGRSPGYTATRLPVKLVHVEPSPSMAVARQRERQIKRWSRAKKSALIANDLSTLHELSKRRH